MPSTPRRDLTTIALRAWPGLFLVAPLVLLAPAVGRHRVPGLPGEPLFATLVQGVQLGRWLRGLDAWGNTGLVDGIHPQYWPAQLGVAGPLAVLDLLLEEPWAYALLLVAALVLAGLGPALLARRLLGASGHASWIIAGLCVQLSPPVLRCAWDGGLALLVLGPLCLALASRRPWAAALFGLLAGGMGALSGLLTASGALLARRPWALAALLPPLLLAVLLHGSMHSGPWPGSANPPLERSFVPAYVGGDGAMFPLPHREPEPSVAPGAGGWLALPARLHGGPVALIGCLLGLAWRRSRPWALLGLGAVALLHLVLGPLPPPGGDAGEPAAWVVGLLGWLPGGAGVSELLILPLLAAGMGFGALVAWRREASVIVLAVVLWASPLQPGERLPVTNLPPLPATAALADLGQGQVLLLPAVASPFRQPGAGDAELMHLAHRLGRPLPLDDDPGGAALIAHIARTLELPVHVGAAPVVWFHTRVAPRELPDGHDALLVDAQAYTPEQIALLRVELQRLFGPPRAEDPRWLLWAL
jgi:hypothetical protein